MKSIIKGIMKAFNLFGDCKDYQKRLKLKEMCVSDSFKEVSQSLSYVVNDYEKEKNCK